MNRVSFASKPSLRAEAPSHLVYIAISEKQMNSVGIAPYALGDENATFQQTEERTGQTQSTHCTPSRPAKTSSSAKPLLGRNQRL